MKALISIFCLALCLSSCVIRSNVGVPARQEFVLGDNGHGAFKVEAKNTGDVPVEVSERYRNGSSSEGQVLQPGEEAILRFAANSAAILRNDNDQDALVKVKITGDTGLNMGYEDR